ncbi:unnamed protein product [Allacma fusca]|uniref:Uncharacterized protein n=1 Tax=Allacma fusca TaxID=39272 RepID=A0A8J2NY58_9HEXA|nr:unnamed protein product [Allacma fusca]
MSRKVKNTKTNTKKFGCLQDSESEDEGTQVGKNSSITNATLAKLETDSQAAKSTLETVSKDIKSIRDTMVVHTKKIEHLEKRAEKTEATQSRHNAEIIHLKNEVLQLKNAGNLSFAIISGVNIQKLAGKDVIISSIQGVLSLTGLTAADVEDASTFNLGKEVAIKCKFRNPGLVGRLLKNAYHLKGSNFRVQPDLSPDQRAVRKHLLSFAKDLCTNKPDYSFQMKSWRYLMVKSGMREMYYESDGVLLAKIPKDAVVRTKKPDNITAPPPQLLGSQASSSKGPQAASQRGP